MPKISIDIPHKLSKNDARNRINKFASTELSKSDLGLSELNVKWHDKGANFSFKITAVGIKGDLLVEQNFVNITSNIPFIFFPLKGQIEKIIRDHAATILK